MKKDEIEALHITEESSLREAVRTIDRSGRLSIALLVDDARRLVATITDGDFRRGIMAGFSLDSPVRCILPIKAQQPNPHPVTAPVGTPKTTLLKIMQERRVRQLPLVDDEGRVVDIVLFADLLPEKLPAMGAVIMAGGFGTRLRPLTDAVPKPMLPVGDRPLMQHIVEQLREAGIHQIVVTTHYRPEKIIEHFGDGRDFDVTLNYVREDQPLGTGGSLGLITRPREPMLVINGDILTHVDFRAMLAYHQEHRADMTVAVRHYGIQVPYGVMECDGSVVKGLSEKPQLSFFVNAGIYLLEPGVFDFVPSNLHFNMTDLIQWLLGAGKLVVSFPVVEYWLDIGRPNDYQQAQDDARNAGVAKPPAADDRRNS